MTATALSQLARALNVRDGTGCSCALCGASPFASAGVRKAVLGPNFAGHETLYGHPEICRGCQRLLAGRPGDDPAPLRTISCAVIQGTFVPISTPTEMATIFLQPPPGLTVLSWAESGRQHHWRHAGTCSPDRWVIGHDTGAIIYDPPRDALVLAAVRRLLAHWPRRAVALGTYNEAQIARYGATVWDRDEALIAPARISRLVALLAWCLPPSSEAPIQSAASGSSDEHSSYIVLCEEERAKGFVRPYRDRYQHVGVRPTRPTRDLTPEEWERHNAPRQRQEHYVCYEPDDPETGGGRFWTADQLRSGCNGVTTMGRALSETYARDPTFHGATFCVQCNAHFPVAEFTWSADGQPVGS